MTCVPHVGWHCASVADARPDSVARVVYVDSGPTREGGFISDESPVVDGEIPLPDWSAFEESELADLTDEQLAAMHETAIPVPEHVPSDPVHLTDERRYGVPTIVIATSMPKELIDKFIAEEHPYMAELAKMKDRTIVELPTGHWPQLTKPVELGQAIVAAIG
jgi:pimeloyl-ACP methyl ester carboxylesterase